MKIKRKLELLNSLELAIVPLEKYGVTGDHICKANAKILKSERKLLLMDIQKQMMIDIQSDRYEFETVDFPRIDAICLDDIDESYEFYCDFSTAHHDVSPDPCSSDIEEFREFDGVDSVKFDDGAFSIDFSDVKEELNAIIENKCETSLNLTNEPV